MLASKVRTWVSLVILTATIGSFSRLAFSEAAEISNLQVPAGVATLLPPQKFCQFLIEGKINDEKNKRLNLCLGLQLDRFQMIPGLGLKIPGDLFLFLRDAVKAFGYFTDPEKFKEITQNAETLIRKLGFEKLEDLLRVKPGRCFVLKRIKVSELKAKFTRGDNPDDYLFPLNKIRCLLEVPGNNAQNMQAESSLTFMFTGGKVHWSGRGLHGDASRMGRYKRENSEVFEFPGSDIYMLGSRDKNGKLTTITPLYTYPIDKNNTLKEGVETPIDDVFVLLKGNAQKLESHLKNRLKKSGFAPSFEERPPVY